MLAAEQVSTEILSSSEYIALGLPRSHSQRAFLTRLLLSSRSLSGSPNMPAILDLRTQIVDRLNRLKGLIGFITENGLLGKVSFERTNAARSEETCLLTFRNRLVAFPFLSSLSRVGGRSRGIWRS